MVKLIEGKARPHRLILQDQIPKFGSGLRFVSVASVGRKWVVLTYAGKRARIPQQKWVQILVASINAKRRGQKGG